jgi:cytochrome b561
MSLLDLAEDVHWYSIILLLVLLPAHVGAALVHHFWWRHDVLSAMLPEIPDLKGFPEEQKRNETKRELRPETGSG